MARLTNFYSEIIEGATNKKSKTLPNYFDFKSVPSLSHTKISYVIDYTLQTYLYLDPSFARKFFGYEVENFTDSPLNYSTMAWNKNDFKIVNEKILPEAILFLKQHSISDYPDFLFSFNYRIRAKEGKDYTFLQTATYYSNSGDSNSLSAAGSIVNITNYKTDSNIIHTVERIDEKFPASSKVALFKSVYYPDKAECVLSKRELEIVTAIYEGLSSKDIADRLCISINTVNNHRKNMMIKTKTKNSFELLNYARNKEMLQV